MKTCVVKTSVVSLCAFVFLASACHQVVDMQTPKPSPQDKPSLDKNDPQNTNNPDNSRHTAQAEKETVIIDTASIPPEKRKLYLVESFAAEGCLTLTSFKTFVATFQANSGFEYRTIAFPAPVTLDSAVVSAKTLAKNNKLEFIALVNAGFFNDGGNGEALSFYESSLSNRRHSAGNARGTRPCLVSEGGMKLSWQNIGGTAPKKQSGTTIDTSCAGPMLLQQSQDVLDASLKDGEFAPKYRKDGSDPLSLDGRRSRTAICRRENGTMRLLATNQYACGGMSMRELQKYLKDYGCVDAMAFDGGASTGFYAIGNNGTVHSMNPLRKVPVWQAVFYRPPSK